MTTPSPLESRLARVERALTALSAEVAAIRAELGLRATDAARDERSSPSPPATSYRVSRGRFTMAVDAPRWLLGRTWGQSSDTLKVESRFGNRVIDTLRARGHDVEVIGAYDEAVGHAGAVLRDASGMLQGGTDRRSDGGVAAW